jgi:hypothetical protein
VIGQLHSDDAFSERSTMSGMVVVMAHRQPIAYYSRDTLGLLPIRAKQSTASTLMEALTQSGK